MSCSPSAPHARWTGPNAILALAIACNRPVQLHLVSTNEAVLGHAPNLTWTVTGAMLEMACAVDEGVLLAALPCT